MDGSRFDALARSLSAGASRRGALAALLSALGLAPAAGEAAAKPRDAGKGKGGRGGKGHGRNRGNGHGNGRNRTGKRCNPRPKAEVCAGKCGPAKDNCGKRVDCGPCSCATTCGECGRCDRQTGTCVAANGGACCDGGAGSCLAGACAPCGACETCGAGGCAGADAADGEDCGGAGDVCFAGSCCTPDPDATTCAGACGTVANNCGIDVDCTPLCAGCCDGGACRGGAADGACGTGGEACDVCVAPETCGDGKCGCTPTTCVAQGRECGAIPDGCGATVQCGTCPGCCDGGTCVADGACCPSGGVCAGGSCAPEVATRAQCGGRCSTAGVPATVTGACGPAACPSCDTCGGCGAYVGDGGAGEGFYCASYSWNTECSSRADCGAGRGCFGYAGGAQGLCRLVCTS